MKREFSWTARLRQLAAMMALLVLTVDAWSAWLDDDWVYRKQVTVQASQVVGSLSDFPAMVRFTDADLAEYARNDGFDLVFTASDGETVLPHEIERFNGTTGELIAWVRLPALTDAADLPVFLYFGNPASGNQQNPSAVWSNGYRMVQHLQEPGGPGTALLDSTANANHGVVQGNLLRHPDFLTNEIINGARRHPGAGTAGGCTNCTTTVVGGDVVHTWVAGSGTFTPPPGVDNVRYMIVGGGGGGGGIVSGNAGGAGGGGAGGYRTATSFPVTPGTSYSVTVGAGGVRGTGSAIGGNGGTSSFATLVAAGGGGGGSVTANTGATGGSGGGGRLGAAGGNGNSPATTPSQGNRGGNGDGTTASNVGAGGGGGAGAVGSNAAGNSGGNGGAGAGNNITGTLVRYAGGGGGGGYFGSTPGGARGVGVDGGGSAPASRGDGTDALPSSGGGGGGASGSASGAVANGGSGGSGIVVVRYTLPPPPSLTFPHSSSLSITGPITAEAWAFVESGQTGPDHNPVFWKGTQVGWGANYLFRIAVKEGTNTMTWGVTCGGQEGFFEAGAPVYNQWAHYALTFDGTRTRAYINGLEVPPVENPGGATACSGQSLNAGTEPVRSGYAPNREVIGQETFLRGRTDELRLSAAARPANWLRTQFIMINDPASFVEIGGLQAQPADLSVVRTVDTPTQNPGGIVTYDILVTNDEGGIAKDVALVESLSRYVRFVPDAFGAGQHFQFEDSVSNPSGLTFGDAFYSEDGVNFVPIPGPAGWENTATQWRVELDGEFVRGGAFTLRYRGQID
ncbi:MAG: DUF2341 domain-containing protein [Alcanivorax sp.]|nr:DUF2341 domain-containing protein [Alcanivorax sp.]